MSFYNNVNVYCIKAMRGAVRLKTQAGWENAAAQKD